MGRLGIIDDVIITPEKIIANSLGDIYHAVKNSSRGYHGFGEAYFSFVDHGAVKGWKKHLRMTLNLIVPVGTIKFVLYDARATSATQGTIQEVILCRDNYCRLTVPPGIWNGFQGLEQLNLLLNIADMPHDSSESERLGLENEMFKYEW